MAGFLQPKLRPKIGLVLRVIIVARISTIHQDPRSLADQISKCRQYIRHHYDGEIAETVLQSQGSGEHLDREELLRLEEMILSGEVDVVIAEDLGRICRRTRVIGFCEDCLDHSARLIALNDGVDTAADGWQDLATMATWHHERSNRDTSSRIKRSLTARFLRGELIKYLTYGYIKPPGAKTDADIRKDPTAEPVLREIFERLQSGARYSEIADWLNDKGVIPGPFCRRQSWTCAMVSRLAHNSILKGVRVWNRTVSRRVHKTGRHHSVKADQSEVLKRDCPHLAFFEAAFYDRVIREIDERNAGFCRVKPGATDSRQGTPRKQTRWPGQHARCAICGRLMYWTRDGNSPALICSGAHNYKCWNSQIFPGKRCLEKLTSAILTAIEALPGFDAVFVDRIQKQAKSVANQRGDQILDGERKLADVARRISSVLEAIELQHSPSLLSRLSDLEVEQADLQYRLSQLRRAPAAEIELPTKNELRKMAETLLARVAEQDQQAGRLLSQLVPDVYIAPYQICDGDKVVSRAHLTLQLSSLLPSATQESEIGELFKLKLVVDLFDAPQRVAHREQIVKLREQGLTEREAAAQIGITGTAAQAAMSLHRAMHALGLSDPYIRLYAVPETSKLGRHLHPRFKFEPLPGFPLT